MVTPLFLSYFNTLRSYDHRIYQPIYAIYTQKLYFEFQFFFFFFFALDDLGVSQKLRKFIEYFYFQRNRCCSCSACDDSERFPSGKSVSRT